MKCRTQLEPAQSPAQVIVGQEAPAITPWVDHGATGAPLAWYLEVLYLWSPYVIAAGPQGPIYGERWSPVEERVLSLKLDPHQPRAVPAAFPLFGPESEPAPPYAYAARYMYDAEGDWRLVNDKNNARVT